MVLFFKNSLHFLVHISGILFLKFFLLKKCANGQCMLLTYNTIKRTSTHFSLISA